MIRKYTFGTPFCTEAVTAQFPAETGELPYFEKGDSLTCRLEDNIPVYGLGEQVRGINKRGWSYTSNCSDDPNHLESTHSLYAAHNFLLLGSEKPLGIFIDYPGKLTFDIGYTRQDELQITPEDWNLDLYLIEDDTLTGIVRQFRSMIGQSYIPPKWAFGYGQSRWGYKTEADFRKVAEWHRENHIPLDAVYMDIDYMERYKDFTISEERFPDFEGFVADMKSMNLHLVPIIDAGVKVEKDYPVYEEGVKNNYFCKEEDGTDFTGAVWPGRSHFPDMLNPKVRRWFGHKYQFLLDKGIDGFWNDMNEPAIFYSEKRLKKIFREMEQFKDQNLDMEKLNQFLDMIGSLANSPEDYRSFYHHPDGDKKAVRHDKVHNLYGYLMTRAAQEAFEELVPDKRILMFSRSSYVGMHRYGGIWQGDNLSWWSHLLLNIKMMPSLNMCGFLYTGADLGGFGADTTEDLLLRWLQFGIFTPLMRNHSAMGTREQEVYLFSNLDACRNIIRLRYCLLPYLYSEYMKAALHNEMMFRPLAFDYPDDPHAAQVEDQLLLGESLMLAPVYQQNASGRYVYLPERMLMVTTSGPEDFRYEVLEKGHHYVNAALEETIFFIRENRLLLLAAPAENVDAVDTSSLTAVGLLSRETSYTLYEDDGNTKKYENPEHFQILTLTPEGSVTLSGAKERYIKPVLFR